MIKTIIQVAEIGIGLTIALFLGAELYKILNMGIFDTFNNVFDYFVYLFGYNNIQIFVNVLCGILIVMAGRWIMSWASNNGGQTPNNNGN